MSVLVDSSVWIDFFRNASGAKDLDYLLAEDLVVVNDLILAELVPALQLHSKLKHIRLMQIIHRPALLINWSDLIEMQVVCLRKGINNIGIPDLIIAQHAIQNDLELYSMDKHFRLMANHFSLRLYV